MSGSDFERLQRGAPEATAVEQPAAPAGRVTVHRFTVYDIRTDESVTSTRMATAEAIERIRGVLVGGTAREIDAAGLDPAEPGMTPRDYVDDLFERLLKGPA